VSTVGEGRGYGLPGDQGDQWIQQALPLLAPPVFVFFACS
jgi:hypothetical protein